MASKDSLELCPEGPSSVRWRRLARLQLIAFTAANTLCPTSSHGNARPSGRMPGRRA